MDEKEFWRGLEEILNKLDKIEGYEEELEVISYYSENNDDPGDNIERIIDDCDIFNDEIEFYRTVAAEIPVVKDKYADEVFLSKAKENMNVDWLPHW